LLFTALYKSLILAIEVCWQVLQNHWHDLDCIPSRFHHYKYDLEPLLATTTFALTVPNWCLLMWQCCLCAQNFTSVSSPWWRPVQCWRLEWQRTASSVIG
jgi:hypothetical protein